MYVTWQEGICFQQMQAWNGDLKEKHSKVFDFGVFEGQNQYANTVVTLLGIHLCT